MSRPRTPRLCRACNATEYVCGATKGRHLRCGCGCVTCERSPQATVRAWCLATRSTIYASAEGRSFAVRVEAPAGFRWEPGLHELVETCYLPGRKAAWWAMRDRLASYINHAAPERCTEPECEWCGNLAPTPPAETRAR